HDNRHHHGQREEPLPHPDDPLRLPGIAPLQLAWSQQGRTEQVRQTLFHLFHRWHGNLGAVTKLGMGTGLRMLLHHGGPPLLRVPHDSAYDCLELKLRPVIREYIRTPEAEDRRLDQMDLWEEGPPVGGSHPNRFERFTASTALSGSTFCKPPALPEVADCPIGEASL